MTPKESKMTTRGRPRTHTDRVMAELANVSHDTIWKMQKIEAVPGEAAAEIKAALSRGDMKIHTAYRQLREAGLIKVRSVNKRR
jgi:hypothetical protein